MASSKRLPRYITPEMVNEGDLIRVTWRVGEVEHSRMARVSKIHHGWGHDRSKLFVTASGDEIYRYSPYSTIKVRVTLIEPAPVEPETLSGLDEIMSRV